MFQELEGLERGAFLGGLFPNPVGIGGTAFTVGGGKFWFVLSWLLLLKTHCRGP